MKRRNRMAKVLFAVYAVGMLILLFGRARTTSDLPYWQLLPQYFNAKPFASVKIFLYILRNNPHFSLRLFAVFNLVGNVVLFIPLGFFLPVCFPKLRKFGKTFLASFGIIAAVEVTQMLTLLGNCDIDDFLLNLPGACIGYGIFFLLRRRWPNII